MDDFCFLAKRATCGFSVQRSDLILEPRARFLYSQPPLSLTHELLIPLIYIMFHPHVNLARKPIGSANCFKFYRIFASKLRSDCTAGKSGTYIDVSCKGIAQSPRPLEEFCCRCRETRTSRIPFTLGNPCGYQLPEIPHTYPIRSACCRPLHI